MSQRIVINVCYGVFGLSRAAFLRLRELGNEVALKEPDIGERFPLAQGGEVRPSYMNAFCWDIPRDDPLLVQTIKELGTKVTGASLAKLKVVKIPDGLRWTLTNFDGMERVEEQHRSWGNRGEERGTHEEI